MITEQVKRATENLKKCGLQRSEFRVNVERKIINSRHNGKYVQYGNAQIVFFCSLQRVIELTPELIKYFHVTHSKWDNAIRHVSIEQDGGHELTVKEY